MPQLDFHTFPSQLFWLAVTFILLYVLMAKVALPRIGKIVEERRSRLDGDLEKAGRMKSEAEAVIAAYEKALSDARAQAQATVKSTQDRLAAVAAERQREVSLAIAEQTAGAEKRIAAAKETALANVRTIAVEVARSAASRLIGSDVGEAGAAAAVDKVMQG